MWAALLVLFFVTGSRQLSIKEFSVPKAVETGEDIRLSCQYELEANESDKALFVKWWWTPTTSDERDLLYQGIIGRSDVARHNDIGVLSPGVIMRYNVTPDDSGTYECEVSNIDEVRKHETLIVYTMGSGPELNITLVDDGPDVDEEDDVLVTCTASDVAPYPDLVVTLNGDLLITKEFVSPSNDSTYDIIATTVVSKDKADGGYFDCELFYKDANITHSPYVDKQTFYADLSALSTTETAEDVTTEATSDPLQYTRDAGHKPVACVLLIILTSYLRFLAIN